MLNTVGKKNIMIGKADYFLYCFDYLKCSPTPTKKV